MGDEPPNLMAERVAEFMREARQNAGGGRPLAELVGPFLGRVYDEKSISNMVTRRSMPGADVLFAAAAAMQMSVDPYIAGQHSVMAALEENRRRLDQLREEFDVHLQANLA